MPVTETPWARLWQPGRAGMGVLLAVAVSSCSVLAPRTDVEALVEVPGQWASAGEAAQTGAPSLAQWWLRLNDPLLGMLF